MLDVALKVLEKIEEHGYQAYIVGGFVRDYLLGTVTNDGVYGIQSAFKEAGAKTIVSTLWSINDRAAAEFMKIFYTYMIDGDTKYDAFEKARRAMIESEDYNDPLYWAPFIMLD